MYEDRKVLFVSTGPAKDDCVAPVSTDANPYPLASMNMETTLNDLHTVRRSRPANRAERRRIEKERRKKKCLK